MQQLTYNGLRALEFFDAHDGFFSCVASVLIAAFTFTLWRATVGMMRAASRQTWLTQQTIDLARDEFVASHRPRLRVRNVVVHKPDKNNPTSEPFDNGIVRGQLYVSNFGDSAALINEIYIEVWPTHKTMLPMERPYEGKNGDSSQQTRINAGESAPFVFAEESFNYASSETYDIRKGIGIFIYVMGWIEYLDEAKVVRRLAFCRKYNPQEHRFVKVENSDYEHEE